jgi:hypothetical protein
MLLLLSREEVDAHDSNIQKDIVATKSYCLYPCVASRIYCTSFHRLANVRTELIVL